MTEEPDESENRAPRQEVVRVPGRRRAQLTPVPGTDTDPESAAKARTAEKRGPKGPNDDRLMQDVPPHY
ncbi:hypothetical protein [Microbacterium hydrocarbonoxydans]|uniref:Uncharacterized protein n=1 Tax=Microbacterium hydrocarbonoxydans TaxID=273678 RepID=A0A1H4K513_9MICO|nr:hypothetical protein [Microbacterium hydrocarbonoxydans]SEB53641.1 hypothetical protein SAMN04489807_1235 [Microbacterium hydrocarbonoxydans]